MARLEFGTIFSRGLRLQCPRCGGSKLFRGWFKMNEKCDACSLKYERDPGYFLGSAYINYGLTAVSLTILYITLHFIAGIENRTLTVPLIAYCVLIPVLAFRHARSMWLAMDCFFDRTGFDSHEDGAEN